MGEQQYRQQFSKDMLLKIWKAQGMSEEELARMENIFDDIFQTAKKVKEDYETNPSKATGAVDLEKGLVSGSGIEIHSEAIPDDESDDWELMPKINTKDISSMKTKSKKLVKKKKK